MAETVERSPRTSSPSRAFRHRYARMVVRGLAVAGFAGVAWLLSSSAAHAADRGTTTRPDSALSVVTSLVTAPVGSSGGSVLSTATNVVRHLTDVVDGGVVRNTPTLRSTGSTTGSRTPKHAVPRTRGAEPATTVSAVSVISTSTTRTAAVRQRSGAGKLSTKATAEVNPQRPDHAPLLPRPAPVPAPSGTGMTGGAENTGSGSGQSSGAYAIAPTATVTGSVADHRPETAADNLVRPLITERPTVSPD